MSLTSAPPRRDLYELAQTLTGEKPKSAADTGGFLVPANRRIRIGAGNDASRISIYNADYMTDGTRYARFDRPWTVFTAINFRAFTTHHEALEWAIQEATK